MEHQLLSGSSQNYSNNNFIIYQKTTSGITTPSSITITPKPLQPPPSRYESQKRRDWNTFNQYLRNHRPLPVPLTLCSGSYVLEFLKYLDQFGKTKVHIQTCIYFGHLSPPSPCTCPLRQAWGSLDALIGRLRAAYEEHGGTQETNPFGARVVRVYLREVRDYQGKARGISYDKKRKRTRRKEGDQEEEEERQLLPLPTTSATVGVNSIVRGY